MTGTLKELYGYRAMIWNLVRRELRGRYKGSLLGAMWNYIIPLVQILVYVVVFSAILRSNLDHYAIFLISGMLMWIWFSESLCCGSETLVANGDLLKKIYFPRSVLPIVIVISKMVNFFIMLGIYLLILAITGYGASLAALLYLPLVVVLEFFFILGMTLALSAVDVYLRDTQYLVSVAMISWVWITPIMYLREMIDSSLVQFIFTINPLTYFADAFQAIFYWKCAPSLTSLAMCFLIAASTMIIGILVFRRLKGGFAEELR